MEGKTIVMTRMGRETAPLFTPALLKMNLGGLTRKGVVKLAMRGVAIILIMLGTMLSARAQTPLLQALIDATPVGGTLTLPSDVIYPCNCVISKSIRIESFGARPVQDGRGRTFFVGATIVSPNADSPVRILPGVDGVSIEGTEITSLGLVHTLVEVGGQGTAQDTFEEQPRNVSLNHVWIHGLTDKESQRGVAANGQFISITNSRIDEIHGIGYDTQAICVWNGSGPFNFVGNYLSASGENIMFGGSPASIPNLVPSDITIRNNYFFKPLSWYFNDPSYAGIHWSVKNLFELKNARRVVIEGNIFENNWTDAQAGRAIVFTPRPNDSGLAAVVEDVLFQNNIVRNVASGMLLLGHDQAPAPTDIRLKRVRILNNLFENIDGPRFGSNGVFLTVIAGTQDVIVEHNTAIQTGNIISADYDPNTGFIYRDNITRHNQYGIMGSNSSPGNATIAQYFPGSIITSNLIAKEINAPWNTALIYPAGNLFPESLAAIEFVDLLGGNYRLSTTSPYKGVGTNGTDPGCDIDALNAALNGTVTPLPSPTPTPTPAPSPTPTPTPMPLETRKVAWPKQEGKQKAVLDAQWAERFRLKDTALPGEFAIFERVP